MSYIRQLLIRQALRHKTNRPSGLIGQYKPYLNSNDSPTRDILKDYSGQGHDIQLYNFGYALQSGYGSWDYPSPTIYSGGVTEKIGYNKYRITNVLDSNYLLHIKRDLFSKEENNVVRLKVTYISEPFTINFNYKANTKISITENGIYEAIVSKNVSGCDYINITSPVQGACDVIIEFLPDYPGALVSDGVDDYGLCETPFGEAGTVIVMFDEVNWVNNTFLYNAGSGENRIYCWKSGDIIANGEPFTKNTQQGKFNIFARTPNAINDKFYFLGIGSGNTYSSVAVYSMELYSKKLTDEEIESVKEAMYNEYLTATNALQNHIIADYECYDKTNEDEDRDVLKDLSGNGHDIQLYNFGFAEGSGYGKYQQNFNSYLYNSSELRQDIERTQNTFTIKAQYIPKIGNYFKPTAVESHFKNRIKVTGLPTGVSLVISLNNTVIANADGIYDFDIINNNAIDIDVSFALDKVVESCNVIIEQIPEYQGALVSDGVDDYGLCENFPILNTTDGYTIIAIRKIIGFNGQGAVISKNAPTTQEGAFLFEGYSGAANFIGSFGAFNIVSNFEESLLSYQTSKLYNGISLLEPKNPNDQNKLKLFGYYNSNANSNSKAIIAFYRAMILNKDCTTEEIKFIAKQMVAKHKEKTGETIELNF